MYLIVPDEEPAAAGLPGKLKRIFKAPFLTKKMGAHYLFYSPQLGSNCIETDLGTYVVQGEMISPDADDNLEDIAALEQQFAQSGSTAIEAFLKSCRGNFALIIFDKNTGEIQAATDQLSSRPIFYSRRATSFALSSLEEGISLLFEDRKIDWNNQAIFEAAIFKMPLAERTLDKRIEVLDYATLAAFDGGEICKTQYHVLRYGSRENGRSVVSPQQALQCLKEAVQLRLKRYNSGLSLISGGMDSRLIAAILHSELSHLKFINFGIPGLYDYEIAPKIAALFNAELVRINLGYKEFHTGGELAQILRDATTDLFEGKRDCIWTGDGGSVLLGAVYIPPDLSFDRQRSHSDMVKAFIDAKGKGQFRATTACPFSLTDILLAEFQRHGNSDPAEACFSFLIANDQRRHIWSYFRPYRGKIVEPITPFMDGALLRLLDGVSIYDLSGHKFYSEVFALLPEFVRSVPWQTYRGHVPCPIKNEDLRDQWGVQPTRGDFKATIKTAIHLLKYVFSARWPKTKYKRMTVLKILLLYIVTGFKRRHLIAPFEQLIPRLSFEN